MEDNKPQKGEETAKIFKFCLTNITTASQTKRKDIFHQLSHVLEKEGISDVHLKGTAKFVALTLHIYRDKEARFYVTSFLRKSFITHGISAASFLLSEAVNVVSKLQGDGGNKANASLGLSVLSWCQVVSECIPNLNSNQDLFEKLVKAEVLAYNLVARFTTKNAYNGLLDASEKLLVTPKKPENLTLYIDSILKMDSFSMQCLPMIGYIYHHLLKNNQSDVVEKSKKKLMIDVLIKTAIQTKIQVPTHSMIRLKPFLKCLSREEFTEMLPIIQKALLRNPEIVMEAIGYLLNGLSIDPSTYMEDLAKSIPVHFSAKNADIRNSTIIVIGELSKQCSDLSALEVLLKKLFNILSGSEGKLALPEQRAAVLTAIKQVSNTAISGKSQLEDLAKTAVNGIFPFLLNEGNEATLLEGLSALRSWCKYFTTNLPTDFIQQVQNAIGSKTSTPVSRAQYILACNEAIKGNTLVQGLDLLPTLLQLLDKCKTQALLPASIFEALVTSVLIARISTLDDVAESKLEDFFNSVLDHKKRLLVSEKVLAHPTNEYITQLANFMNVTFLNFQEQIAQRHLEPWYQAIAVVLVHGDWKCIKIVKALLKKLLTEGEIFDRLQFKRNICMELNKELKRVDPHQSTEHKRLIKPYCSAYMFLVSCVSEGEQTMDTLSALLFNLHQPELVCEEPKLFVKCARILKVNVKQFVVDNKDQIMSSLLELESFEQMHINAMKTILSASPESLVPPMMMAVVENFQKPALVTVTQKECAIMQTPDGQAYDRSVYESAKANALAAGNQKRESKAYSYKDQQMEKELREEMKKKKPIQTAEPELNKKQKEQLHVILEEEKNIRDNLKSIESNFIKHTILLDCCLDADFDFIKYDFNDVMSLCLTLSSSYLAAPHIVPCYLKLAACAFGEEMKHLGELVASVILRHRKTPFVIPGTWCEESLKEQTVRALNTLHTFVFERNEYLMMAYTWKKPFSATAFAFAFPLLRCVSRDRGSLVAHCEELREKVFQLIMAHSKLRSTPEMGLADVNGPEFLPRTSMLSLLSEAIIACDGHNKDNKLQQYANKVFDEVCKSASGEMGCATAEITEIEHLMSNILSACSVLRNASLKGLLEIKHVLRMSEDNILHTLARRIMIARYDLVEENAKLGENLWEDCELTVTGPMVDELTQDITHMLADIRLASSLALSTALSAKTDLSGQVVNTLLNIYEEKVKIPPPVVDNLGRVASAPFIDQWEARHGVGLALDKIAPYVNEEHLMTLFHFFVPTALGDRSEPVRKQMCDAALQYVNQFGQEHMSVLLSIFDKFLDQAPDSSAHDVIRQSVIILTGSLAKHLSKTDPKIKPIFSKLMGALSTPSQQVQQAVANCLPPLCAAVKDGATDLIKGLLNQLLESESYGERRGAAYGLAGVVKGFGILSLKQHKVITSLDSAIQDKKIWRHREGALFAFETLCTMLGRLFEPYVVHLLPHLLLCFGDGNQFVREAADETARAVMKNLSNHGVKLVLPSLLKALEEDAWRTKTGSVELLGAMSFCAPKQLSSCLPSIVPRLTEVLADSHLKVQKAGQQALRQIGGVIKNPEIQEISSVILDALADPNKHTVICLKALLSTSFVHFIDAPSLALIMPTLEKALDQRSTETKKMAAQILGNMYALTDPKDLSPYLPAVVPGLKKSLLDPSPEVRAVSARALGAIVKGMGEDCFNDLMPWLLETLTSEVSSVDRSGAAQGLSDVLYALGQERLDKLMPDVIATTMKTDLSPNIRDGYLMLFIYLPAAFGEDFTDYIGPIIPPILKGLADEAEYVRDTSLKAGQRIINMYSDTAIEFLLPQLEAGLFNAHWRIRFSSVQLLGDLLFKLSGVTGKQTTMGDEDDNFGTAHSSQVIFKTLGADRRNRIYAGLYMGRSDVALTVRQAALHVWKVIVQNTARTLRDILPTLFELLLGCLASESYDKRQVGARTLGDLVRKLGERILPEIIPILEHGLTNPEGDKRQGVCIGLSEIMNSTSRDMISQFEDSLINTVRLALVDPLAEVRLAASETFENLHNTIGHRALDGVLPSVFSKLDDPELSEYALDGLKQVMAVKSKSVLPFLVPKLTTPPVNTKALAILSSVAGEALTKHLEKILPAMIEAVNASGEEDNEDFEGTKTLILSVSDEVGMRTIIDELLSALKKQNPGIRKVGASLLAVFCKETLGDYSAYVQQLFRVIIQSMNDVDEHVILSAWEALNALVKHLDPSEQLQHLPSLKQAIRFVKSDIRSGELPGFCILKKGITPILPIFREGILNGPQDVKEQTARLLGEIIQITSAAALKPSVVHITGPLIRILGDRFNWNVKEAILDTLGLLLEKVGIMLKPFLPQLQTTFVKALNDPTQAVREKAAWALGLLTVLHTRVDSLFTELKNGVRNNEDSGIRETTLKALRTITLKAGAKMSEGVRAAILETLEDFLDSTEDGVRVNTGAALGALFQVMTNEEANNVLSKSLTNVNQSLDWTVLHGRAVALSYALFDAPTKVFNETADESTVISAAIKYTGNDRVPICTYGVHCLGHVLRHAEQHPVDEKSNVVAALKKSLLHASVDVKIATLKTIKYICKTQESVFDVEIVRCLLPEFVTLLRDRNTAVKCTSEVTLGFMLQLHKNDELFDKCVAGIEDYTTYLQDFHKNAFTKLSELFANEDLDYQFAV